MRLETSSPVLYTSASIADVQHSKPPRFLAFPLFEQHVRTLSQNDEADVNCAALVPSLYNLMSCCYRRSTNEGGTEGRGSSE